VTEAVGGGYNFLRLGEGTALNILDVVHDHAAAQVSHVIVLLLASAGLGRLTHRANMIVITGTSFRAHGPQNPGKEVAIELTA